MSSGAAGEQPASRPPQGFPWKVFWMSLGGASVVAAVVIGVMGWRQHGRKAGDEAINRFAMDFTNLGTALRVYKQNHGQMPNTGQGLQALVEQPKIDPVPTRWVQVMPVLPVDAWGNAYRYEAPARNGAEWEVRSAGADGEWETGDDLSSQDPQFNP